MSTKSPFPPFHRLFFSTVSENLSTKLKREHNEIVKLLSFPKNRQTFVLWGRGGGGHARFTSITFKLDAFTNVRALFSAVATDFCKIILINDLKKKPWKGL